MKALAAEAGSALVDEPEAQGDQFAHLPLAALVPSLTNPRTLFDKDKLQELAASIQASGVHQPILVRPLPGDRVPDTAFVQAWPFPGMDAKPAKPTLRPTHEIVCGQRRYLASQLAGVETIPALIRRMTDAQVLEVQIIENLQRADLTELEEAEGYERLMQHSQIGAEQLGDKIGKSRSYIYARLKLLDLCQEAKQALREGRIDASRALLIARIPDGKLQVKALAEATRPVDGHGGLGSVRALQTWLQQHVMLRLEHAPFNVADAGLCPDAGSCKTCPKRTGANPDLFADVDGADICTDPPCYQAKEAAHRGKLVAKAEAKGLRVIDGKEAQAIVSRYGSSLKGYSRLDQQRNDAGGTTLRKLLGKEAPNPVLIENPWTKELIEAVPTEEAEAVLVTKGAIQATKKQQDLDAEIDFLRSEIDHKVSLQARRRIFETLIERIHAGDQGVTDDMLRAWLISSLDSYQESDWAHALRLEHDEEASEADCDHACRLALQRLGATGLWRAFAVLMITHEETIPCWENQDHMPVMQSTASALGVDLQAIRREVKAEVKAEVEAQIKALKAEAAPADAPPAPPAKAGRKPAARKAKISATEAEQGIAAAMQGLPGAPAEAATPPAQPGQIAVGQAVRVTRGEGLSKRLQQYAGCKGTVAAQIGPSAWDVTLKGRGAKRVAFDASELEVLA